MGYHRIFGPLEEKECPHLVYYYGHDRYGLVAKRCVACQKHLGIVKPERPYWDQHMEET